jgi:hypothetical protein
MPAKHYKVNLLPEERDELQSLVSTGKAAAYKRTRAQILLKADQGPDGPDLLRGVVAASAWCRVISG